MFCDETRCSKYFDEDAECQQELENCTEYPENRETFKEIENGDLS